MEENGSGTTKEEIQSGMKKRGKIAIAAILAGVAVLAGIALGFKGRGLRPEQREMLLAMRPSGGEKGFAVVELFTSEGCSSCPPADALVATVAKQDKDLPVYVLAFHVDYWDRLGWKDAFSSAAWSERQKEYAQWLHLSQIYTPQVVVNGQREMVGSNAGALHQAINNGLQSEPGARLALGDVRVEGGKLDWQAHADGVAAGAHLQLMVALVEHDASTKVMGGENGGKTLMHVQIVRGFDKKTLGANGDAVGHLDWPEGVQPPNGEVIAFLQDTDNGKIIAATRSGIKR
jgi:hypothetical protein